MKVSRAILLLLAIWGAIYLSWLGSQELRGEEARRIVPAQEMLRTGDWIVPRIAGEVYSNKPPLINWLIAASFHLTGSTTEFTARLPSVICLLLLAVVMLVGLRKQLGVERALIVALVFLTPLAMIDKGRLAEIEALYVALFGIAAITWICWWSDQRSPWLYWTVPYLFIGLGLLAKGPPHLLFWVILVTSILLFAKRLKDILHPAHLIGLFLMTSLFLPWVLANIAAVGEAEESLGTWKDQLSQRADYSRIKWQNWLTNPIEILLNFFPWTIPLAVGFWLQRNRHTSPETVDASSKPASMSGLRWNAVLQGIWVAMSLVAIGLCLIPGGLPRYFLPFYPLAALVVVEWYFRLPDEFRARYERTAHWFLLALGVILAIAPIPFGVVAARSGFPVPWWAISLGIIVVITTAFFTLIHRPRPSVMLATPLLIASGFIAMSSALVPFQNERRTFETASDEIVELSMKADGSTVIYADERFRSGLPRHLRMFFYLPESIRRIGESAELPADLRLIVVRPYIEKRMIRRVKRELGQKVSRTDRIKIEGQEFVLLYTEPMD